MNLKELKKMIQEEWDAFNEQAEEPTVAVSDTDIDVDGGGENPEETLRSIYDMLKAYFEGGEDTAAPTADPEGDADLDDTPADDDAADDAADAADDDEEEEALQERFKKLANIIKG